MSHNKDHHRRDKKHKMSHEEEYRKMLEHRHKVPGYLRRQQEQEALAMEKLRAQQQKTESPAPVKNPNYK